MKKSPLPGDWINLVKRDFEQVGLEMNENSIKIKNKTNYKNLIKNLCKRTTMMIW